MTTDWILVTGQPGCGKTTAVTKMVALLEASGFTCRGFYTEEVLEEKKKGSDRPSSRIGFDVVTVPNGDRGVLARKGKGGGSTKGWPKTGAYSVDVTSFEKLALPSLPLQQLEDESDRKLVYVLDEIGRMELHSKRFPIHVRALLTKGVRLVGAVTAPIYGHRVPFCDEVTASPGVQVYNLKKSNRNDVVASILNDITERWIATSDKNNKTKRKSSSKERKDSRPTKRARR